MNRMTLDEYHAAVDAGKVRHARPPSKGSADCPGCKRAAELAKFLRQLTAAGYVAVTELKFHPSRKWRLDVAVVGLWVNDEGILRVYADPPYLIAIEIDGGGWVQGRHHREQGRQNDEAKRLAAEELGWKVLRVSWEHVANGEALALVKRVAEGA